MPYFFGPREEEKKIETIQKSIIKLDESIKQMTKGMDGIQQSLNAQRDNMKQVIQDSATNRVSEMVY